MLPTTSLHFRLVVALIFVIQQAHALAFTKDNRVSRRTLFHAAFWSPRLVVLLPKASDAATTTTTKSRTDGYAVQKSPQEWSETLSIAQYNTLRRGATERQKSSILNTNDQAGTYRCAGCGTALFSSTEKFASNTGWPSFASAFESSVEEISQEVRCATCGGHLGDLFQDGWKYVGTRAAKTGKRYCIDGSALVFQPANGGPEIRGDRPPPAKVISYEQSMYRDS